MISNCKWQWMSNNHGGMGWFSDAEKKRIQNNPEFSVKNGHWRKIPAKEVFSMARKIAQLAYEQA